MSFWIRDLRKKVPSNNIDDFPPLNAKIEDEIAKHEIIQCIVCFTNKKKMLFLPCSHVATCYNCSKKLIECPVCRQKIKEKKQVFL